MIDAYFDDGIVILVRSGGDEQQALIEEKLKQENVSFKGVSKSG